MPHNFFVKLSDYEDKNHLFSTLCLIRCLTESGINRVPEEYFKLMDANPGRDKFEACQIAHKTVSRKNKHYDPQCYANTAHMVTYDGNGDNIPNSTILARFKKKKLNIRDTGFLRINAHWNGSNDNNWKTNPGADD